VVRSAGGGGGCTNGGKVGERTIKVWGEGGGREREGKASRGRGKMRKRREHDRTAERQGRTGAVVHGLI